MMRRLARSFVLAAVILVSALVMTARKLVSYAADPVGEKDCGPNQTDPAAQAGHLVNVPLPADVDWKQRGGTVNDSSCLNRTAVYGVVRIHRAEDIREALRFARANNLKVSVAGIRHSQGGHAFARHALVLDMTTYNAMSLDAKEKTLRVQSGARWHDIQNYLDPGFAVKAMQSTDIFTVGGSIAVNAHGMDHQAGSVGRTVRAMRVMLSDGRIVEVSRTQQPELFNLVVGGYGLFGIVLDADLDVTDNAVYRSERRILSYKEFPQVFSREIAMDDRYSLMYGHLSTAPQSLLDEMILYTYSTRNTGGVPIPPLGEVSSVKLRRAVFNMSKLGGPAMRLKWWAEKYIEPRLETCIVSRNQALGAAEGCFVSRNNPMHDSVYYLKNSLPRETDILQEYFIPRDRFIPFVDGLRSIVERDRVALLNASVRVVHQEQNFLSYAPADAFAIVLYLNQRTDDAGNQAMATLTKDVIDLTIGLGGRFFLPYQLHYTSSQLERSYPEIRAFFDAKRKYDPDLLLTSTFYEKYSR
jgi:FAD/FMN-containing dehydrogenase